MEEGKYYHIFNRGNNRENIFKEKDNYRYFLEKYEKYLVGHVETFAYCLMPNHFHFLIKVKEQSQSIKPEKFKASNLRPIEKAFRDFFISYAKSINKKYNRVGSLFQYKFKRKEVATEGYLKRLVIYIHNNPVEACLSNKLSDWNYSSYNSIEKKQNSGFLNCEALEWFEDDENFEYCHKKNVKIESDW